MSVLLRIFLAVLVLLPPGTFRKLDALTRAKEGVAPVASRPYGVRARNLSDSPRKSTPVQHRGLPEPVRKWTDTTFLATSGTLPVAGSFTDALPSCMISLELGDWRRYQGQSLEPIPAMNAHCGARGLLLALGELLV